MMAKSFSPKTIRAELKKLYDRHHAVKLEIEMLAYEQKSIESAMVPLKEAYDQLCKITGEDLKGPEQPDREIKVRLKKEVKERKKAEFVRVCQQCRQYFKARGPATPYCDECMVERVAK